MTSIIVCGGRTYGKVAALYNQLDKYLKELDFNLLIQGGASGADKFALDWAKSRDIEYITYKADWDKHGKAAGPIRNQEMIDNNPNVVALIAFPGGRGTSDMIRRARKAGIRVIEVTD